MNCLSFVLLLLGGQPVVVPGPICAAPNDLTISEAGYFAPVCEVITVSSDLLFAFNSYALKPSAASMLTDLRDRIMIGTAVYHVDGHADAIGTDAYNLVLSAKRANAVRDALIALGVPPARLVARGLGESRPIAPNTNSSGRAQNRRVELNPSI